MKTIIYKRSVYEITSQLREDRLTKSGYFDLECIPEIRVFDPGFMKHIKLIYNVKWITIANILNVKIGAIMRWISRKRAIQFYKLKRLSDHFNMDKEVLIKFIDNAEFTFGNYHGKNKIQLQLYPRNFKLAKYLMPNKNNSTYLKKDAPLKIKELILNKFSVDKYYYKKSGLINIYSYLLCHFLKTFYKYNKHILLKFPLSSEVDTWRKGDINLIKAVIVPCLLSDGGEKPRNRLFISGASDIIHRLWSDAFYYTYNLLPSSYRLKIKNKYVYVTTHIVPERINNTLKKLSPIFKTSPYRQTKEQYLNGAQPTIKSILNADISEKQIATRIWMIAEGSVIVRLDKRLGLITPVIQLACAHPLLINELKKLFEMQGMHMIIGREKVGWSGVKKLFSGAFSSTINFLKIGGFIRGVKINSNSNYYAGLDKQDVLLSMFEYAYRQRENIVKRDAEITEINQKIQKIAISKGFKDESFYINYFGGQK